MSDTLVDKIARAVLYEGYVLYPYRPSVKSRQRWTFGGVFPQAWAQSHRFGDSGFMQAQCMLGAVPPASSTSSTSLTSLIAGGGSPGSPPISSSAEGTGPSGPGYQGNAPARVAITLRFLHLMDRIVEQGPDFRPVQSLRIGDRDVQSWQEAVEREVRIDNISLAELLAKPRQEAFSFAETRQVEVIENSDPPARIVRQQQGIAGTVEISAAAVGELIRLTVRAINQTPLSDAATRDTALLHSLASTHLIFIAKHGGFISLTDPPAGLSELAGECQNVGCWPVLAGVVGQTDTLLASPIILPDYPQIAPESPGDLFDGCEIDEILTLRIMTLTDEEKRQAAATDDRVAKLLARTQNLAREQLMNLHGAMRKPLTPSPGTRGEGWGGRAGGRQKARPPP